MSVQWEPQDLAAIAAAEELRIASRRKDGSLSPPVTIWCVALHGFVAMRSAYGADNGWYRRARARGSGWISAGGVERDVVLQDAQVSRRHAEVRLVSGRHMLLDLASSNGTWVDEQPVLQHLLSDGDTFRVGDQLIGYRTRPSSG